MQRAGPGQVGTRAHSSPYGLGLAWQHCRVGVASGLVPGASLEQGETPVSHTVSPTSGLLHRSPGGRVAPQGIWEELRPLWVG